MPVSTLRNAALFSLVTTKTPVSSSLFAFTVAGSGFTGLFGLVSRSPLVRTVSAWIGIVTTFLRVAVVIFAEQDRPGRISSGGLSIATTTLKSFASWLDVLLCEAARPVERRMAVLPISMTCPAKVLLGMASMVIAAV